MDIETLSRHNLIIRVFVLADALEAVVIKINKESQELHIPASEYFQRHAGSW